MNKNQILSIVGEVYKSTIEEIYMDCPSPELVDWYNKTTDFLLAPTFTPKTLELTYATIKYWEKNNYLIVPISKETDEWRRYCLLEVLWFKILKRLVSIGCNLDKIAPKLLLSYSHINSGNLQDETKPKIISDIEHSSGVKIDPLITFLGHVVEIIIKRSKASIRFTEKECHFYFEKDTSDKAITPDQAYQSLFTNGISICLSDIVFESIEGLEYIKDDKVHFFTANELEIIKLLNKKEIREITIKIDDGKPVQLEVKEKFDINMQEDATKRLKEFFLKPYQEIKAITNGGRTIHIERTTKQKLNE